MFEESSAKNNINSGEKQSVLWGKVKKWFSSLKSVAFTGDYNDLDNAPEIPQAVAVKGDNESVYRTGNVNITKDNIGLGNVPNVTTDDQTPTYTQATTRENIASGEKLSIAFGKIKKWFADLQTVAFTGSYNNLKDIPSIPEATAVKGDSENTYRTGNVNITKANIGLSNVNNTSDLNKPISTATQLALDDKASIDHAHTAAEIGALPITGGDLMGDLGIISDYPTIYLGELGVTISSSETDTDGWCGSATNINSDYLNLPLYGTMMLNENPIPFPADYIECNGTSSRRTVNAPQFRPVIGATLRIKFSNAVTTTSEVTLNVNSLGAKSIIVPSRDSNGNLIYTPVTSANTWEANEIVNFLYDGTNLIAINSTGDFVQASKAKIDALAGQIIYPRIDITAVSDTTVTVSNGDTILTAISSGVVSFYIPYFGNWTITAGDYTKTLAIDTVKVYKVQALTLADATWEQIAEISEAGRAETMWSIGDEKDIVVGDETLTLVILDFNHDDLSDGSGKAGITFGLKNLMATTRRMEATNTNANGFTGSEMYSWLQGDLLNSLPTDLQTVLKSVNKKTSAGNNSTTINTDAMLVFLFSEIEVFGIASYSPEGEGKHYPYFVTAAQRKKFLANGTGAASNWWERSPYVYNSNYFCLVLGNDCSYSYGSPINAQGVCFGFCV